MNPNPHRARITHNGKRLNLGSYPTKHDAQTAQTAATNLLNQLTPQDIDTTPTPTPQTPDAKTLIKYITQGRYDHATQAIHTHITNRHNLITEMKATRQTWTDQTWTTPYLAPQ